MITKEDLLKKLHRTFELIESSNKRDLTGEEVKEIEILWSELGQWAFDMHFYVQGVIRRGNILTK